MAETQRQPTFAVLWAFLRRDWATARSYRLPFVLDLGSSLFTLVLFFYLGKLIDTADFEGLSSLEGGYFPFAVIGFAVLQVVQTSLRSFTTKLRTEQTTGTLEALLSMPTRPSTVVLASSAYDLLRAVISSSLLVVMAVAFGLRPTGGPVSAGAAVATVLGLLAVFAALGVVVAAFTLVFKQSSALLGIIVSGLALLGGVYFPVEVLPEWIQWISHSLPFTWGLDVLRAALLQGDIDVARLAWLTVAALASVPVSLWIFRAAYDRARLNGSLGQY